ncbi:hypothetical protein Tco_0385548 [Tanacetum coccineum]
MYAEVFRIDVPLTQSQPTESTQGTHRTPSAPRRSTRLTPPAPVPTVDKVDEMILQDTLQVSLAEHKSREEQEVRENVELVNKHLASEEIEKMVDAPENVIDDSPIPRNDDQNIPGTREEEINMMRCMNNVKGGKEDCRGEVMVESLPTMVDKHIKEQVEKQVPEQVKVQVPVYVAKGLLSLMIMYDSR